jgi:hypothetical protein
MTLDVPDFDPTSYGHHNVKGNGSCLVNVCAYALLGTENKAAPLRDSIVRFVQDCGPDLFSMRSIHREPHNLTMEILDGMADEESIDSPFFISKINEKLTDSELEECLVFSHILRIRQSPEKLNFMTNQYATWIKDMYIKYSLGKHKKSVKDGSDTQVLLYFLCLMYDIGFVIWVNGSQNADVVKITYSHVIHRNVQHGNLNSLFPFIHILNTPPGYYLQGNRYHLQHFSLLLPSDNMYNTYTADAYCLDLDSNTIVQRQPFITTRGIQDLTPYLIDCEVILKMVYRTIKSRFAVRDFHSHIESVRSALQNLDCPNSDTQQPSSNITATVQKHQILYRLLLLANSQFR